MKFWVNAVVDCDVQEQLLVGADSLTELRTQLEELLKVNIESLSVNDFQRDVMDPLMIDSTSIIKVIIRTKQQLPRNAVTSVSSTGSDGNTASQSATSHRHRKKLTLLTGSKDYRDEDSSHMSSSPCVRASHSHSHDLLGLEERESSGTCISSKKSLSDAPRIERICVTRDRVVQLLHKKLKRKFVPVLTGCFARVRELQGYFLYQIVEVTLDNKLVFDRIYSNDKRDLDTVSNALPMKDEINGWMKRMLSSSRPYPTNGFIEAKHGDLSSALRNAAAALQPTFDTPTPPLGELYRASPRASTDAVVLEEPNEDEQSSQMLEDFVSGSRTRKGSLIDVGEAAANAAAATRSAPPSGRAAAAVAAARAVGWTAEPRPTSSTAPVCAAAVTTDSTRSMRSSESPALEATPFSMETILASSDHSTAIKGGCEPQPPPDTSLDEEPRARRLTALRPLPQACFPTGKVSIKVNDSFSCVQVRSGTSLHAHHQDYQLIVSASRHSNAGGVMGSHRARRSDFSGCMLTIDPVGNTIIKDRDVTEKGFAVYCFPVRWGEGYVSMGQLRPVADDAPYWDEKLNYLVQQFTVFKGPSADSLYETKITTLPLPTWCGTNSAEAFVCQVQLVVHRGLLHAFYVIRCGSTILNLNPPALEDVSVLSSVTSAHTTLAPLETTSSCSPVPLTSRSLTALNAPREPIGAVPSSSLRQLAPLDSSAIASGDTSIQETSSVQSVSPSHPSHTLSHSYPAVTRSKSLTGGNSVDGRERFGLAHAVTSHANLQGEWKLLSPCEPVCSSVDDEPVFAVCSMDLAHDSVEMTVPSRSPSMLESSAAAIHSQLNIAWRTRTTPSHSNSPRKFQPVRPTLPKHRDPMASGKSALPFQRFTNSSEGSGAPFWKEDCFYASNRVDPSKIKQEINSVSLFQAGGSMFVACGYSSESKLTLWTVPISME